MHPTQWHCGRPNSQLVGGPGLRGHHPAVTGGRCALLQLHLPTGLHQNLAYAVRLGLCITIQCGLGPVTKRLQALLADVFLVSLEISQNFGRVCARCTNWC